jgi:hypothetical protein
MSRSQLEKLSIADVPSGAGAFDYYNTFSVVQEGSDEASRQVLSIEQGAAPVIEDGQTIVMTKNYDLTVSGLFKKETISGLQTLADNRTDVVFGGFGLGGQILQMDGKLNLGQVLGETASFRFNSPREAKGGYDVNVTSPAYNGSGKHSAELCYSTNGLAMYKWQEGLTSGLAAGWSLTGSAPNNVFSGGVQTLDPDTDAATMFRYLYLPFNGNTTVYFHVKTGSDTAVSGSPTMNIISYTDYIDTVDVTGTPETFVDDDTEYVVSITPSSNAKMIKVIITVPSGDLLDFVNPTVQTSSTYNFVEFNT